MAEQQYFVMSKENNQSVGPMNETEVRQWISQKLLNPNDMIARVGDSNWISISQSPFAALTGPGSPSTNLQINPHQNLQNYPVNQTAKPPVDSSILFIRWVALFIDSLCSIPLIFMAVFPVISLLGTPLLVAYLISRDVLMGEGQSIGKRVMGLKVVKSDGSPVIWADSVKRNIVYFAFLLMFIFTIPWIGTILGFILLIPVNLIILGESITVLVSGRRIGDHLGTTYVTRAY